MAIEKDLQKYLDKNNIQGAYKVIEYNSNKTYLRINWYRPDKSLISRPLEYFKGVSLSNINTIDRTIDASLTEIIKY